MVENKWKITLTLKFSILIYITAPTGIFNLLYYPRIFNNTRKSVKKPIWNTDCPLMDIQLLSSSPLFSWDTMSFSSHCLVDIFIMICSTSCENMGCNLSKIGISLCCGVYFGKWSRLSLILLIFVWKKSARFSARVSKLSNLGSWLDWIVPIRLDLVCTVSYCLYHSQILVC